MSKQTEMFPELPKNLGPVIKLRSLDRPLWTQHKSKLIARYLRYFVYITKHGTYIDGFAGPQREKKEGAEEMWSARLVLLNEPRWLRNFFLYDLDPDQVTALQGLVTEDMAIHAELRKQKVKLPKRQYDVQRGDFNEIVDELLARGVIGPKEATFALLDQRSLECNWETVRKLAEYKKLDTKIEQFYFLATGWLDRTIAAHGDPDKVNAWWGGTGWQELRGSRGEKWAAAMQSRFESELGYKYAKAWPIMASDRGRGRTMYYMIHATDHPEATKLMYRAYRYVLKPIESDEQLNLALQDFQELRNKTQAEPTTEIDEDA